MAKLTPDRSGFKIGKETLSSSHYDQRSARPQTLPLENKGVFTGGTAAIAIKLRENTDFGQVGRTVPGEPEHGEALIYARMKLICSGALHELHRRRRLGRDASPYLVRMALYWHFSFILLNKILSLIAMAAVPPVKTPLFSKGRVRGLADRWA